MATKLTCSLCERDLRKHCDHCTWWQCTNRKCPAKAYDVRRGTLLRVDGTVEALGS